MNIVKQLQKALLLPLALLSAAAWGTCSPIVIDLDGNGIQLGDAGVGVHFDVNADGALDHVQWLLPGGDEAFLALDRNGNGIVDDGSELFGVGTPLLVEGGKAPNGFVGLAQYDDPALGGNDDGFISNADAIWSELRVWHDIDADGVSTSAEMLILQSVGLIALETIPKSRNYYDDAGNFIPFWARAILDRSRGKKKTLMVDVFFVVLPD